MFFFIFHSEFSCPFMILFNFLLFLFWFDLGKPYVDQGILILVVFCFMNFVIWYAISSILYNGNNVVYQEERRKNFGKEERSTKSDEDFEVERDWLHDFIVTISRNYLNSPNITDDSGDYQLPPLPSIRNIPKIDPNLSEVKKILGVHSNFDVVLDMNED